VKALDAADAAPDAGYAPVLDDGGDAELALTPWTIRNRYYAADVHFAARARGWRVRDAFGVPALVVVWAHGTVRPPPRRCLAAADGLQPIRALLEQIHADLAGSRLDPEVCLAVQLPAAEDAAPPVADVDDDALDELLASLGFEYVDARTARPRVLDVDAEPGTPISRFSLPPGSWKRRRAGPPARARRAEHDHVAEHGAGAAGRRAWVARGESARRRAGRVWARGAPRRRGQWRLCGV
jgi:hypothetical protein